MRTIVLSLVLFLVPPCLVHPQSREEVEREIAAVASDYGGRIGVAARRIGADEEIRVNADSLFPTASVIKLPVLVELFARFADGSLEPSRPVPLLDSLKKPGSGVLQFLGGGQTLTLLDVATLMIILSDNTATNYVIDQFAATHDEKLEAVNARMRSLGLTHTKLLNKLYSFATRKKTEEARRFGIGVSTPEDMVVLLAKLAQGTCVNVKASEAMVGILKNQLDDLMAPRWLPSPDQDTTFWIANKTGSLDDRKIDVGIVQQGEVRYVYSIFCDGSTDLGEMPDNRATLAGAKVSKKLYDYFMKR
jgi:beta-lactamase class A